MAAITKSNDIFNMTDHKLNLHGGVLIIGSLLWQDNLGKSENTKRLDWRNKSLSIEASIAVNVPIRYGRLSSDGIYTMTFANSCRDKNIGTAFAVPFRNNPITTFKQLTIEANALALAEGMRRTFISSIKGHPWCVLGILFNKNKISELNRITLSNWWQQELSKDEDFPRFNSDNFKSGKEKSCIHADGLLNIPWITAININDTKRLVEFDFLIATATLPNERQYPSIGKLIKAIKADNERKYFRNNFANGITTFQDKRINNKLNK